MNVANHVPTLEEMMGWLEERERALSDLLGELSSAQWRGDDKHDQVCNATRAITIVRTIQMRLTPTGEAEARLNAAAPDLREALEEFVKAERLVTDYENGDLSDADEEASYSTPIYERIEFAREKAHAALAKWAHEQASPWMRANIPDAAANFEALATLAELEAACGQSTTGGMITHSEARRTWRYMESLLTEECGLMPNEGVAAQRANLIQAIRNTKTVEAGLVAAAGELLAKPGVHRITVNGKRLTRQQVAEALKETA